MTFTHMTDQRVTDAIAAAEARGRAAGLADGLARGRVEGRDATIRAAAAAARPKPSPPAPAKPKPPAPKAPARAQTRVIPHRCANIHPLSDRRGRVELDSNGRGTCDLCGGHIHDDTARSVTR